MKPIIKLQLELFDVALRYGICSQLEVHKVVDELWKLIGDENIEMIAAITRAKSCSESEPQEEWDAV